MLSAILNLFKPRFVYRSAVTGKFVSKAFADANPETTFRQRA